MIATKRFANQQGGVRLDAALLLACPTSTRAFVRDAIERGGVSVTRGTAKLRAFKGLKLAAGDLVEIRELMEASDNLVAPSGECPPSLFEDDSLLAFDKSAAMPVQPLSCRETGTLMNAVVAGHPECRALGPGLAALGESPLMAGALHRIDADTSGLVLVARTLDAYRNLRDQFAAQTVRKTYLALVEGSVAVGGTLENDLIHDPTLPFCRMIDVRRLRAETKGQRSEKVMHAVTAYRPIGHTTVENEERTLLEVTIFTGVTHQIRAQLALAGMHIVNDRLYGAFAVEHQRGHCLHALAAAFRHPISGIQTEIRTPLPTWAEY